MSKDTTRRSESATDIVVREQDQVVVGLDVHKRMIAAAIRVNGREVNSLSLPTDAHGVLRVIAPYRAGRCRVVFEAGPTGYALARSLVQAGVSATVVSPAQTPRPARIEAKSDRLDCRRLAQFAEQGLLRPVAVPSEQEDHDRQVVRPLVPAVSWSGRADRTDALVQGRPQGAARDADSRTRAVQSGHIAR